MNITSMAGSALENGTVKKRDFLFDKVGSIAFAGLERIPQNILNGLFTTSSPDLQWRTICKMLCSQTNPAARKLPAP